MVGLESSQWCTVTVLLLTCVVPAVPLEFRLRDQSGDACASGPAAMTALQLPASSSLSAPTYAGTSGAGSLALLVWLGNPAHRTGPSADISSEQRQGARVAGIARLHDADAFCTLQELSQNSFSTQRSHVAGDVAAAVKFGQSRPHTRSKTEERIAELVVVRLQLDRVDGPAAHVVTCVCNARAARCYRHDQDPALGASQAVKPAHLDRWAQTCACRSRWAIDDCSHRTIRYEPVRMLSVKDERCATRAAPCFAF